MTNNINTMIGPDIKVRVAYQTRKTTNFFTNKDAIANDLRSNVVYKYKCDQCSGFTYIGETTRHLQTRMREHLTGKPVPSEIGLHQHIAKLENFSIVLKTEHQLIGEALAYHSVPENERANNNMPPFQLKLFNYSFSIAN